MADDSGAESARSRGSGVTDDAGDAIDAVDARDDANVDAAAGDDGAAGAARDDERALGDLSDRDDGAARLADDGDAGTARDDAGDDLDDLRDDDAAAAAAAAADGGDEAAESSGVTAVLRPESAHALAQLEFVNLAGRGLVRVPPYMGDCRAMRFLCVADNYLSALAHLDRSRELWTIDATRNQIASLDGLARFRVLGSLLLAHNLLDFVDVLTLRDKHIVHLVLHGNPCARHPEYRPFILHTLPGVWMLDGQFVTNDERRAATLYFTRGAGRHSSLLRLIEDSVDRTSSRTPLQSLAALSRSTQAMASLGQQAAYFVADFAKEPVLAAPLDQKRLHFVIHDWILFVTLRHAFLSQPALSMTAIVPPLTLIHLLPLEPLRRLNVLALLFVHFEFSLPSNLLQEALSRVLGDRVPRAAMSQLLSCNDDQANSQIDVLVDICQFDNAVALCSALSRLEWRLLSQSEQLELPDEKNAFVSLAQRALRLLAPCTSFGHVLPQIKPLLRLSKAKVFVEGIDLSGLAEFSTPAVQPHLATDLPAPAAADSAAAALRGARQAPPPASSAAESVWRLQDASGDSVEFYSVRLPSPGEWVLLREHSYARIVRVLSPSSVLARLVQQQPPSSTSSTPTKASGPGTSVTVSTNQMHWDPRGFWRCFDANSSFNRFKAQVLRRRSVARQTLGQNQSLTGFTVNDAWNNNFLLASSAYVGYENEKFRAAGMRTAGWEPVERTPFHVSDSSMRIASHTMGRTSATLAPFNPHGFQVQVGPAHTSMVEQPSDAPPEAFDEAVPQAPSSSVVAAANSVAADEQSRFAAERDFFMTQVVRKDGEGEPEPSGDPLPSNIDQWPELATAQPQRPQPSEGDSESHALSYLLQQPAPMHVGHRTWYVVPNRPTCIVQPPDQRMFNDVPTRPRATRASPSVFGTTDSSMDDTASRVRSLPTVEERKLVRGVLSSRQRPAPTAPLLQPFDPMPFLTPAPEPAAATSASRTRARSNARADPVRRSAPAVPTSASPAPASGARSLSRHTHSR